MKIRVYSILSYFLFFNEIDGQRCFEREGEALVWFVVIVEVSREGCLPMSVSAGEREYVRECVDLGLRGDSRKCDEYRTVRVEAGNIPQATGSARVQIGGTDVMVGVKVIQEQGDKMYWGLGRGTCDFSRCVG